MEKVNASPQLSFTQAVKSTWQNMTNFRGRARRSELWWSFLVYVAASCVGSWLFSGNIMLTLAFSVALYVWITAVTVRRLQDNGHSALWVFASILSGLASSVIMSASGDLDLITAINATPEDVMKVVTDPVYLVLGAISTISNLMILIFCLQDSDPRPNKYGDSPKYGVKMQ